MIRPEMVPVLNWQSAAEPSRSTPEAIRRMHMQAIYQKQALRAAEEPRRGPVLIRHMYGLPITRQPEVGWGSGLHRAVSCQDRRAPSSSRFERGETYRNPRRSPQTAVL